MKLAVAFAFLLAAAPAGGEVLRCWSTATRETHCSDGSRAHEFAGVETVNRPGRPDVRCWRGPTGVSCDDR